MPMHASAAGASSSSQLASFVPGGPAPSTTIPQLHRPQQYASVVPPVQQQQNYGSNTFLDQEEKRTDDRGLGPGALTSDEHKLA